MKRIIPVLMAFVMAGAVFANGLGGQRLEKVVGDQIVDIGTDVIDPTTDEEIAPVAGEPIQFDFNLLKGDTRDVIDNTSVTVNIQHDGITLVNSDLIMEPPLTLLVFTFPEAGDYILKVTFYDKDKDLATASFPIAIAGPRPRKLYIEASVVFLLLGIVGFGGFWVGRKRRAKLAT